MVSRWYRCVPAKNIRSVSDTGTINSGLQYEYWYFFTRIMSTDRAKRFHRYRIGNWYCSTGTIEKSGTILIGKTLCLIAISGFQHAPRRDNNRTFTIFASVHGIPCSVRRVFFRIPLSNPPPTQGQHSLPRVRLVRFNAVLFSAGALFSAVKIARHDPVLHADYRTFPR